MYNYMDPQSQFIPTLIPIPQYKNTPYARAYVIFQKNTDNIYPVGEGFSKGTMFPELYDPYTPQKNEGGKNSWQSTQRNN